LPADVDLVPPLLAHVRGTASALIERRPVILYLLHYRASSTAGGVSLYDAQLLDDARLVGTYLSQFGHAGSQQFTFERGWHFPNGLYVEIVATLVEYGVWYDPIVDGVPLSSRRGSAPGPV
jgi:hypothetical protein